MEELQTRRRRNKRESLDMTADLLKAIKMESELGSEGAVLTRVQYRVRAPYTRFKKYIELMEQRGLIRSSNGKLCITADGEEFLSYYDKIRGKLQEENAYYETRAASYMQ